MDQIKLQVRRAHRRLVLQQFLRIIGWSLFASLLVAAIGLGVPKIWILPIRPQVWMWSWIGGSIGLGLLVAILTTCFRRRGVLEAAIEIDRRFGLKERISSSLSLAPQDVETEVGRALVDDAIRKVSEIDVRDQFRVHAPWTVVLPLVPAICVFALVMFVPDAVKDKSSQANAAAAKPSIVKKQADKLHQQIQKKREELKEKGLSEADQLMKELEKGIDELHKDNVDKKKALIKLNDLAKVVEEKRQQLAGSDEMRKQMQQLKDLQKGPADDVAKAMKEGNFDKAIKALEELENKISKGELTEQEKQDLMNQLSDLQKKLEGAKQAYDEAKKQLEEQIKEKMQNGDLAGANELQKQLDKLNKMAPQMNQMQKMAQQLGEASDALQNGDAAQASQKLSELAENLKQMEQELDQLESLDEMLDQLSDAKSEMGDMDSDSQSSQQIAQMGQGQSQLDGIPGYGLDEGKGRGERPEEKTDTSAYDSQTEGKINKGKAVMTGHVDGPNIKGESREDVKAAVLHAQPDKSDPLTDAQLPKDQKDHTREYFEKYQDNSGDKSDKGDSENEDRDGDQEQK